MAYFSKKILAGLGWLLIIAITGCSSNPTAEDSTIEMAKADSGKSLNEILQHPQLYVDQDVMFKGVIESVEIRKVNKEITLLTFNMTPVENGELLRSSETLSDKFIFIEKLRQFEDLFTSVRYKDVRIRRHHAKHFQQLGFDLKIAASKIDALAYYFEGEKKLEVAKAIHDVAKGYKQIGEAYFNFQKAALESSPGSEARESEEELLQIEKFENSLRKGGLLLLGFAENLSEAKELILDGHFSYNSEKVLNPQRPAEILTYSSLLRAESWEREKVSDVEGQRVSKALSLAVKDLGEGDKLVNEGMRSLGNILDKTAVQLKKDRVPTMKCAYYGYNGSHLKRCAQALKQIGHFPVGVNGLLLQSDLREEVNVMWVNATQLNIDGMIYALDYGEESSTVKGAVELYKWAESVEEGD